MTKLRVNLLTPRQTTVLALLAGGHSMRAIADRLGITYRTVAFHKYEMMRKIGILSNAELLNFAFRRHILQRSNGRKPVRGARVVPKAR